jgi:hypothetical protein
LRSAAERRGFLEHGDAKPASGQRHGACQAGNSTADDQNVRLQQIVGAQAGRLKSTGNDN